jgi:hypothetical protein
VDTRARPVVPLFARHGFTIVGGRDIIAETMPTWDRIRAV